MAGHGPSPDRLSPLAQTELLPPPGEMQMYLALPGAVRTLLFVSPPSHRALEILQQVAPVLWSLGGPSLLAGPALPTARPGISRMVQTGLGFGWGQSRSGE